MEGSSLHVSVESVSLNLSLNDGSSRRLNLFPHAKLQIPAQTAQLQFQIDFGAAPPATSGSLPDGQINLLFHEFLLVACRNDVKYDEYNSSDDDEAAEEIKRMYVENMGCFGITALDECYRYLVAPLALNSDIQSNEQFRSGMLQEIKIEIRDNFGGLWFVGEWPVEWVNDVEEEKPVKQLSESKSSTGKLKVSPSVADDSFESVSFSEFDSPTSVTVTEGDFESVDELPPSPLSGPSKRLIINEDALPPSRRSSPLLISTNTFENEEDEEESEDLTTVDLLHQMSSLLVSSSIGQFVSHSLIRNDPKRRHLKTSFSAEPIWLLGVEYRLQSMEDLKLSEAEAVSRPTGTNPAIETRLSRSNQFASMVGRSEFSAAYLNDYSLLRQVLMMRCAGPNVTESIRTFTGWNVLKQTPALLKLAHPRDPALQLQIQVFSLTPTAQSPPDTPELFIIELEIFSLDPNASFVELARLGAYFTELVGFLVRMDYSLSGRTPDIVLMESANAHFPQKSTFNLPVPLPAVRISPIPITSDYSTQLLMWSEHLQAWILQIAKFSPTLGFTLHPLIDANSQLKVSLPGAQLHVSKSLDGLKAAFSLITADGDKFYFKCLSGEDADLKEIIGRIRFLARRRNSTNSSPRSPTALQRRPSSPLAEKNSRVLEAFLLDFQSRFWFTYRKGFPRIGSTLFTTDTGWGCMLRTGQSLMAEALARHYFGRSWRWWQLNSNPDTSRMALIRQLHSQIIQEFADLPEEECPQARFSVHRLAQEGAKIGTPIGQWFGPSILSKVLK